MGKPCEESISARLSFCIQRVISLTNIANFDKTPYTDIVIVFHGFNWLLGTVMGNIPPCVNKVFIRIKRGKNLLKKQLMKVYALILAFCLIVIPFPRLSNAVTDGITFVLPADTHVQNVFLVHKVSQPSGAPDPYYYYQEPTDFTQPVVNSNNQITTDVSGFDFTSADTYYVVFMTSTFAGVYPVTQSDLGTTMDITGEVANYTPPQVDTSSLSQNFTSQNIGISFLDQNNFPIYTVYDYPGSSLTLPAGTYNFDFEGIDDQSNGYMLQSDNVQFSGTNSKVTFDNSDTQRLSLSMDGSNVDKMTLDNIYPIIMSNSLRSFPLLPRGSSVTNLIYSSKYNNGFNIEYVDSNNWYYSYTVGPTETNMALSSDLTAKILLDKTTYAPNDSIDFSTNSQEPFQVFDANNHPVSIYHYDMNNEYKLYNITFTDTNNNIFPYTLTAWDQQITLPNEQGILNASFNVPGSAVPVTPATTSIELVGDIDQTKTVNSLESNVDSLDLQLDGYGTLQINAVYADGTKGDITNLATYVSSDQSVAYINEATGVVTASHPGTTTITVSYQGKSVSIPVTVERGNVSGIAYLDGTKDTPLANGHIEVWPSTLVDNGPDTDWSQMIWLDTDANGAFSKQLADGDYTVKSVQDYGTYKPLEIHFSITNGVLQADTIDNNGNFIIAPPVPSVTGTAYDENGQPLTNGVVVFAPSTFSEETATMEDWNSTVPAMTDSQGHYDVALIPGSYKVIQMGNQDHWYELNIPLTSEVTAGSTQTLDVKPPAPNVEGVVYKDSDGTMTLDHAWVQIRQLSTTGETWAYDKMAQTDSTGHFSLAAPDGTYQIVSVQNEDTYFNVDNLEFTVPSDGAKTLVVKPAVPNFSGTAYSTSAKDAVFANAWVDVQKVGQTNFTENDFKSFRTDAQGHFSANLSSGDWQVNGVWDGESYHSFNQTFTITDGSPLVQDIVQPTPNLEGTVKDSNGEPLQYAGIDFVKLADDGTEDWSQYHWAQTDTNGHYQVNLPAGDWKVESVYSQDAFFNPDMAPISLTGNETTPVTENISQQAPSVSGYVKDSNNTPLVNAVVHFTDEDGNVYYARTDENGQYSVALPAGSYTMFGVATMDGFIDLNQSLTAPNSSFDINIPANNTHLTVKDKDGNVVANSWVEFVKTDAGTPDWSQSKWLQTDASGQLDAHFEAGDWSAEGYEVDGNDGSSTWKDLEAPFTVSVTGFTGTVQPPSGLVDVTFNVTDGTNPVSGAVVTLNVNNELKTAKTDSSGNFHMMLNNGDNCTVKQVATATSSYTLDSSASFTVDGSPVTVNVTPQSPIQ
jgi:protocatechuate 3,4-dioxygenase beta subunit